MKYNPQRVVDFNAPFLYLLLLHHTETMGSDEMDCSLFFIVNSSRPRLWLLEQQPQIVLVVPAQLYM